jgi:hypothetical protein
MDEQWKIMDWEKYRKGLLYQQFDGGCGLCEITFTPIAPSISIMTRGICTEDAYHWNWTLLTRTRVL